MSVLAVTGATIVTPTGLIDDGALVAANGVISAIGRRGDVSVEALSAAVDARGLLLSAGLIDVQLNGGFGHDFTQRPASMWEAGRRLAAHGVTAFLPTIITSPPSMIEQALAAFAAGAPAGHGGAIPLGVHLEGPFLSPAAAGAHAPSLLRQPDAGLASTWSPGSGVRMVTLAPELDGALDLTAQLAAAGVVVSAGHSAASYEKGVAGIEAGVRYATHLLNAMPPLDRRRPGLVAALLEDERVTVGTIPDGIHVHPAVLRLIERLCGTARLSAVTDATAALGMPAGEYELAGARVTLDGATVRLANGTLAGSALTADEAIRRLALMTGRGAADALAAMTSVPARLLGETTRGVLAVGARADLVLWTPDLEVVATYVAGEEAFAAWP